MNHPGLPFSKSGECFFQLFKMRVAADERARDESVREIVETGRQRRHEFFALGAEGWIASQKPRGERQQIFGSVGYQRADRRGSRFCLF